MSHSTASNSSQASNGIAAQQQYPAFFPPKDDEIDLRVLWSAIWKGKVWIVAFSVLAAALAVVVALMLPNKYTATAELVPAQDEQTMLGKLSSQLGGLANLAGIRGKSGGVDKAALAIEILKSRAFLVSFINRRSLQVPLIAGKGWNEVTGEWVIDADVFDPQARQWRREVKPPQKSEPSDWELYNTFIKFLSIGTDKQTSVVTISLELRNPVAAEIWLKWLIADLNEQMRERDVSDAKKNIDYLQQQLEKTRVSEMQQIFYELIAEQTKTMMLAEAREDYVFKVIDPPVAPETKTSPKRTLIVLGGVMGGGFLGIIFVLIRSAFDKRNELVDENKC